jgi:hypothetical protein
LHPILFDRGTLNQPHELFERHTLQLLVREHGASVEIQLPRGLAIGCVKFGTQMNPTPRCGEVVADPPLDHEELSCLFIIYEEAATLDQMKLFNTGGLRDGFF